MDGYFGFAIIWLREWSFAAAYLLVALGTCFRVGVFFTEFPRIGVIVFRVGVFRG